MTLYPTSWDLITLWLQTHYEGVPVVALSDPMGCSDLAPILDLFPHAEKPAVVNSQYSIIVCETVEKAIQLCNSIPDSNPFAFVWDGKHVVHENT